MANTEKDYEDLLRLFNKHKVKYCIVGAFAVAFHAVPRYTKDMDIFVEASPANARRIIRALRQFGFSSLKLTESDFSKPGKTIQLGYEPVRLDLLTTIDGCTFSQVWKNRKRGRYGKERVYFPSWQDLVSNKKASDRPQDRLDLGILKELKRR